MNSFATPEWDSNPIADKTCNELFKARLLNKKKRKKKVEKSKKLEIKTGRIEKAKTKQKNLAKEFKPNSSKLELVKKNKKPKKVSLERPHKEEYEPERVKKGKPKITHQTLFNQTTRKNRLKMKTKNIPELKERILSKKKLKRLKKKQFKANQETSINNEDSETNTLLNKKKKTKGIKEQLKNTFEQGKSFLTTLNKKQKAALPLRERMLEKLKGARFRYLNEQMYTTEGKDAKKYFEGDEEAYQAYHEGYKQQVERWPLNPLDVIIEKIKKMPKTHIVADFGCGEAKLAKSVPQQVHSFDLVAVDASVTACDMAHVPLTNSSVDVAVFCLSLMGTNLRDYLIEANRVLKTGGLLKIAEVESRFDNVDDFIKNVQSFGFVRTGQDLTRELFYFLDFTKKDSIIKKKNKLPNITLNPCLYKKR